MRAFPSPLINSTKEEQPESFDEGRQPSLPPGVVEHLLAWRPMTEKRPERRLEPYGVRIGGPAPPEQLPLVEAARQLNGARVDEHGPYPARLRIVGFN